MGLTLETLFVFLIVGGAAGYLLHGFYGKYLQAPLARFFLKRGKVALAMKIRGARRKTEKDCGGDCGCD
jgi:hypothetical protein